MRLQAIMLHISFIVTGLCSVMVSEMPAALLLLHLSFIAPCKAVHVEELKLVTSAPRPVHQGNDIIFVSVHAHAVTRAYFACGPVG